MVERYTEKQISPDIVSRQYGGSVVAEYERDIEQGTENVRLFFRTVARTINTNADTPSGEAEVAPKSNLPPLYVDTSDLSGTLAGAGTDPHTGADLTNVSKAGILQWFRALFSDELSKKATS